MIRVICLIASCVLMAFSGLVQSDEGKLEGVVRGMDLNARTIVIDETEHPLADFVAVREAGGESSTLSKVGEGAFVQYELDQNGRVWELVVFPQDPVRRRALGYGAAKFDN